MAMPATVGQELTEAQHRSQLLRVVIAITVGATIECYAFFL